MSKTAIVSIVGVVASIGMAGFGLVPIPTCVFAVLYFSLEIAKRDTSKKMLDGNKKLLDKKVDVEIKRQTHPRDFL